jgi:hypothetical protein
LVSEYVLGLPNRVSKRLGSLISTPHLILRGITGEVEHLIFVDAGEAGVVGELADDLLLLIELEELGGGVEE